MSVLLYVGIDRRVASSKNVNKWVLQREKYYCTILSVAF